MLDERPDRVAFEVSPSSVAAIAEAVLAIVDDDLHDLAVAHVGAELARRDSPQAAWMSVGELADMLGVHQRTIYRALSSGRLVGVRVGAAWRVRREDLETWLGTQDERQPQVAPPSRTAVDAGSFRARVQSRATWR